MRQDRHREAWTAFVEGREEKRASKYGNERTGGYASKREAAVATNLAALASGECEDCHEEMMDSERRRRCGSCQKLVCAWCWGHIHGFAGGNHLAAPSGVKP